MGSNDVTVAAAALHIPCSTMFDYEWATMQHQVNCRLALAVVVPEAIPPERLHRYGARGKLGRYPGLKEEYYLADFEPDPAVLDELALDATRPLEVVRTPPADSLYHRFENPLFALGTPVYTVFEGRLGAVDERLLADGRLRQLRSADEVELRKRPAGEGAEWIRRDPGLLADLLLSPVFDGTRA